MNKLIYIFLILSMFFTSKSFSKDGLNFLFSQPVTVGQLGLERFNRDLQGSFNMFARIPKETGNATWGFATTTNDGGFLITRRYDLLKENIDLKDLCLKLIENSQTTYASTVLSGGYNISQFQAEYFLDLSQKTLEEFEVISKNIDKYSIIRWIIFRDSKPLAECKNNFNAPNYDISYKFF